MATRSSGYEPIAHERFYTPAWVTGCLFSAFDFGDVDRWVDPCAGAGHICAALEASGVRRRVIAGIDLNPDPRPLWRGPIAQGDARLILAAPRVPKLRRVAVTNPPYGYQMATAIDILTQLLVAFDAVAMLLPAIFDSRASRRRFFERGDHAAEISITTRIRWENVTQKKNGPSGDHCWHVWDRRHDGPRVRYWRAREDGEAFFAKAAA